MTGTLEPATRDFYRASLEALARSEVDFLLGGAYAFRCSTGIERHTKDLDVFVRPADLDRALSALGTVASRTEKAFPHWLAKAHGAEGASVDVIYRSGNGLCEVDDAWFAHARADEAFEVPVRLCPPEEVIWCKAFVQERERFDGADVAHLLRASAGSLDWTRLVDRFGPEHAPVLLAHLALFGYIYPGERDRIPPGVMDRLVEATRSAPADPGLCRGPMLSRSQYLIDVESWGYRDARLGPGGTMTPGDVATWTRGIDVDGSR